jgi:hypothetical protein
LVSVATLLDRLQGVRDAGPGRWTSRCPAHPDKSPSLSIRELADGTVLLHCFAGCGAAAVLEAVGLQFGALFAEPLERRLGHAPMPAGWALMVLNREAAIVGLAASDIAAGRSLTALDAERVVQAAGRIASVAARTHEL